MCMNQRVCISYGVPCGDYFHVLIIADNDKSPFLTLQSPCLATSGALYLLSSNGVPLRNSI
jgi:hypothetical protein